TWAMAPNSLLLAEPELMVMTGMPALTAFSIAPLSASGLAIDTTMPSTFCVTALSINLAWAPASPSEVYSTPTRRSSPACSAPFLTTFQNASPGVPWVMTAKFRSPSPPPPPPVSLVPPLDPLGGVHATSSAALAATASPENSRRRRDECFDLIVNLHGVSHRWDVPMI